MSIRSHDIVPAAERSVLPPVVAAPPAATAVPANAVRQALQIVAQVAGFWAINALGHALAGQLGIALPGNLLGMVMLFALLASGIVKLEWVNAGATLLLRHLAFFFIPVAVGLMTMGGLMRSHGIAIAVELLASAAAGILVSAGLVQILARTRSALLATKELAA